MPPVIKAIVFKTNQLQATRDFFQHTLQLRIKENSVRHFVVDIKKIRLVFLEWPAPFETALYLSDPMAGTQKSVTAQASFEHYKDPNGINIVITNNDSYQACQLK